MLGLCGESTVGVFQKKRNVSPAGGSGTMFDARRRRRCRTAPPSGVSCCRRAGRACAAARGRARTDARASAPLAQVEAVHVAVLRFRVHDRPVGRILLRVEAVAAADPEPVGVEDADRVARRARAAPGPVVLQAAAHVVRLPHVGADRVELPGGHRVDEVPGVALVVAHVEAAVVAVHHVVAGSSGRSRSRDGRCAPGSGACGTSCRRRPT